MVRFVKPFSVEVKRILEDFYLFKRSFIKQQLPEAAHNNFKWQPMEKRKQQITTSETEV